MQKMAILIIRHDCCQKTLLKKQSNLNQIFEKNQNLIKLY